MKSTKDTAEDSKLNTEKLGSDKNKIKTPRTSILLLHAYTILDTDINLCYYFPPTFQISVLQQLNMPLFCFIINSFLLRDNFSFAGQILSISEIHLQEGGCSSHHTKQSRPIC